MTPAEVITLEAAREGRRRPPADYGQFPQRLSADELAEFFLFDQRDQKVITGRRGEQNRLGFAVQLGTGALPGQVPRGPLRGARRRRCLGRAGARAARPR